MLNELNDKQEKLMEEISLEYEENALDGDDSYDIDEIVFGINFIYQLSDLQPPEIVICNSPMEMAIEANLKSGETIDYLGNGYDSGWTAWCDYFQRIGIIEKGEYDFDKWRDFILKSGVFATCLYENVAFVCIKPCKVNRNSNGDLHSETQMAIYWRDGYGEYYLNGVSVEENIVLTPSNELDSKLILTEKNAEVRREIVRKIGVEKLCKDLGANVVDMKDNYELLDLNLGDNRIRPYLKMINPSIGTYHIEGVHPDCRTVDQALEFRNGRSGQPVILT